ncbi:glycosyltransferase family 2 protein [Stenotrophomonas sp.]|uniref:glycosyltransferase family 2 protein n=1 Tax=Stenotrophomonas sp. TaxID=69392 RepID=UPI0028ACA7F4|nr:glycosyltransferase family 2 protein [Stenotrophomonas sp.]
MTMSAPRVAVLVPCYNEELTVAEVVSGMRAALPDADIYVFDNQSTDATAQRAREAGAIVRSVKLRGKGNVVRRQFADIEADVYLMVDGDATYHAPSAPLLVQQVLDGNDMVVGLREATDERAYRRGHAWGNIMLTTFLSRLFGRACRDILSGYRGFSRRFVKSFPMQSAGFEIETELTVHALELRMPVAEVATPYAERPDGSVSKLNTWGDGFRILGTMLKLFAAERPLAFYGIVGGLVGLLAAALLVPVLLTYFETGLVPRFPTLILASALMVLSTLLVTVGLILDVVTRGRREMKTLAYLGVAGPSSAAYQAASSR